MPAAEWLPLLPDKDQPVLAAAIRYGCTALVTGDRMHFGSLYGQTIQGVTIHSPRSLAELLLSSRSTIAFFKVRIDAPVRGSGRASVG